MSPQRLSVKAQGKQPERLAPVTRAGRTSAELARRMAQTDAYMQAILDDQARQFLADGHHHRPFGSLPRPYMRALMPSPLRPASPSGSECSGASNAGCVRLSRPAGVLERVTHWMAELWRKLRPAPQPRYRTLTNPADLA